MMMMRLIWVVTHVCFVFCLGTPVRSNDVDTLETQLVWKILQLHEHNKTFAEKFDKMFIAAPQETERSFPCSVLAPSSTTPTSVHSLRPGDISVVAALGDSLTAGRGIKGGLFGLLTDYRGLAWSIGGDGSYTDTQTLPNILRQYNPYVYGASTGVGSRKAKLNVAITGAISEDMLGQAETLVARMKSDKNVDFTNSWKLITIFIGANDLCDWCENLEKFSAATYKKNLEKTLDYLHTNVPRAFVNLVEVLNVEVVQRLGQNVLCQLIHTLVCDCAANANNPEERAKLVKLRQEYQSVSRDLVASGRYDVRDDFTVVLQPFYRDTAVPTTSSGEPDLTYFASDCFHYSRKGQAASAEALWNNMVEPVGRKRTAWSPMEVIECPTEANPYLYTAKNSNFTTSV